MIKARNVAWLTGCRLTGDVVNLLLFVLISRRFGPSGAGQYSYGFALATLGFVIGCLGIEEYGVRQYARIATADRPAFLSHLLGTQSIMIVAAVLALAGYVAITTPDHGTLLTVCCLGTYQIIASLVATLFIPSVVAQQMMWPALAELSARLLSATFATVAIVFGHAPLHIALCGYPIAALLWLTLALLALRRFGPQTRFAIDRRRSLEVFKILWSFALLEIFAQLFARVGVIVLTLEVSEAAAGYYATGLRLIEVALMPLSFLGVAAYPQLSQLYAADPGKFRRSALDLLWLMVLAGAAVAWGLYFVAPHLLVPVLGERFGAAAPVIQWMALLAVVQAVEVGLGRLLLSADHQVAAAVFIACGAALSLVLNVLWVPRYATGGAIFAAVGGYLLIDVLSFRTLAASLSRRSLVRVIAGLGSSIAATAACAAWLAHLGQTETIQAIASAALYTALAALAYRFRGIQSTPYAIGKPS